MRKIHIYINNKYICTTTQAKNLRDAIEKFSKRRSWYGLRNDGSLGMISNKLSGVIKAYYGTV